MLNYQIQLDFNVHRFENSAESQIHVDANRVTFSSQCKKVFDLLMDGSLPLSVKSAMVEHNINSLPRRILDLKENGVLISDRWIEVSEIVKVRFKVWYMTPEQIEFNKTLNK